MIASLLLVVIVAVTAEAKVSCGHHTAPNCGACPQGNGASWCNGHCKWCGNGCELKGKPCSVDGNWGQWSGFEKCSQACGGGVQMRMRTCNNPPPSNGGAPCPGPATHNKQCNSKACSDLIGKVYVQANTLGLASYHFDSETNVYISYASPRAAGWRFPKKKQFHRISFNNAERIFQGDILWGPNPPRATSGCAMWSYLMHFSADYSTIQSGGYVCYRPNWTIGGVYKYGVNLHYKRYQ